VIGWQGSHCEAVAGAGEYGGWIMRVVELSDHPGAMLQAASQRRLAAEERAQAQFKDALAQHHLRVADAQRARDQARAQHRWWLWLRCVVALRRERWAVPRPPIATGGASDREKILEAGIEGEDKVASRLGGVLGDDWTLFRGYRNRRGEIDHLLLGPQGLVAIEGKHRNATVYCDGDEWRFIKYDRYGNPVERGRIVDRRGRSPSVQLNEPASLLEGFLRSRGHPVSIERVVLLTHPRSRIGTCTNLTVHVATTTDSVIALLKGPPIEADQVAQIKQLILRDHRFHESRRSS
jgi:hypothetical protein